MNKRMTDNGDSEQKPHLSLWIIRLSVRCRLTAIRIELGQVLLAAKANG